MAYRTDLLFSPTQRKSAPPFLLTAVPDVERRDVHALPATRPAHLAVVVVGAAVRGANWANNALAHGGTHAVGDTLLVDLATLAKVAGQ